MNNAFFIYQVYEKQLSKTISKKLNAFTNDLIIRRFVELTFLPGNSKEVFDHQLQNRQQNR